MKNIVDFGATVSTVAYIGEIGVAREDITPPIGIYARNWAAATHDAADGIHRPLTATALVIGGVADSVLVLVAVDLGWWKFPNDEWYVRSALLEALNVRPAQLLLSLSHTHAGPVLSRVDEDKPGGEYCAPYLSLLRDRLIQVAGKALKMRRPAKLSWRYHRCNLACNRDLPSADSRRYLVGYNPCAPADDTLLVGRVEDLGTGAMRAVLVNYACHPTTLAWENRLISPDYPGAMRALIEASTGAPCMFLQGASGDLAPAHQYVADPAIADSHGRRLGHAVLAALEEWPMKQLIPSKVVESGPTLACFDHSLEGSSRELQGTNSEVPFHLRPLPSVLEFEETWRGCMDRTTRERILRQCETRRKVGNGLTIAVPLWTWRIGEAIVVAQPNEAYSGLQLELRRRFAPRPVVVLNITNGYIGYLPPREQYIRDQYSVWSSPFAEGSLESLIESASKEIGELLRNDGEHAKAAYMIPRL